MGDTRRLSEALGLRGAWEYALSISGPYGEVSSKETTQQALEVNSPASRGLDG